MVKGTMKTTKRTFISSALAGAITVTILTGITTLTTVRAADLTPAETKAIAEEGFIYGLPIVMNYAVMYEYAVDKNSGQYKAPFNQINNEARVFTYKDTADRHAEQRHALFACLAGPARRTDGALRPGGGEGALLLGACSATATPSTTATSAAAPPAMMPAITWWSAPIGKARRPPGIKKVFQSTTQFSVAVYRTQLFNPEDMPNVVKVQSGYKVQPLSAYLKQPAPPAAPAINFPKINKELAKTDFFDYLDFALQFAPPGRKKRKSARSWPASASARERLRL